MSAHLVDDAMQAVIVDTLRTVLLDTVATVARDLPAVVESAKTGATPQEQYASPTALYVEGKLIRTERAERAAQAAQARADRRRGLLPPGKIKPPGFSAAPGTMRAIDVLVQTRATLAMLEKSALEEATLCRVRTTEGHLVTLPGPVLADRCGVAFVRPTTIVHRTRPIDPTDHQLLATIAGLAADIDDADWLGWATDELTSISRDIVRLHEGVNAAPFPGLCPHCDRPTLVRHKDEGVIRCEADRKTGHREDCVCGKPDCGCTRGARHTWDQANNGWHRLAGEIRHADETRPRTRRTR